MFQIIYQNRLVKPFTITIHQISIITLKPWHHIHNSRQMLRIKMRIHIQWTCISGAICKSYKCQLTLEVDILGFMSKSYAPNLVLSVILKFHILNSKKAIHLNNQTRKLLIKLFILQLLVQVQVMSNSLWPPINSATPPNPTPASNTIYPLESLDKLKTCKNMTPLVFQDLHLTLMILQAAFHHIQHKQKTMKDFSINQHLVCI